MQPLVDDEADTGAAARHPMAVRWRRSGHGRDAYGERLAASFAASVCEGGERVLQV